MQYTYEIVSVDTNARVMEVVYTHATHGFLRVSARLPFEGELLEDIIKMFSPAQRWREMEQTVVPPAVGTTGSLEEVVIEEVPQVVEEAPAEETPSDPA